MYTCPHCHQPGVSAVKKALLGPGSQMKCATCGEHVAVHFKPWLKAAIPGALVMVAALFFKSEALMYGISAVGLVMMIGLHLLWVPLEKC